MDLPQPLAELLSGQTAVLLLVFAAALLVGLGVFALVGGPSLGRRLDAQAAQTSRRPQSRSKASIRLDKTTPQWLGWLKWLGERFSRAEPDSKGERLVGIRRKLVQAGFYSQSAVSLYFGLRVALATGLPLAVLGTFPLFTDLDPAVLTMTAAFAVVVGLFFPAMYLRLKLNDRQRKFRNGFPDTMDMLLVCVQAGLGLDAAIDRVGLEMKRSHPLISEQLGFMGGELRAGRRRDDALRALADRIGIEEVAALATLLVQSEKLGASLSDTLRAHAADMRAKRMLRAEEKANMLPVLLAIPLVLFVLPALMTVVMTPAVIRVVRDLLPTLSGSGN
jgi:tight adherence protein C